MRKTIFTAANAASGAERGLLVPGANVILNGVNLWRDGDAGTKVAFHEIDAATGEVAAFTAQGRVAVRQGSTSCRPLPITPPTLADVLMHN